MADNRKKPASKVNKPPAQRKVRSRQNGMLWTWLAIGIVVAVVATIVVIKTTSSPPKGSTEPPTSQTVYNEITTIPASVFNTVGVTSPVIRVFPPSVVTKVQKPLTFTENGKTLPGAFYWGAEYCPYCAATRWGIIAALSRFGTFDNKLYDMSSSPVDYAPNTPTFSFYGTTYSSKYLVFKAFEVEGPLNNGVVLMKTPTNIMTLVLKYNKSQYFPFMDMGNKAIIIGTAYDPLKLAGLTRDEIAAGLTDPTNPATQAIVATANYISAGLCATTHGAPSSVCTSSGVMAAATALHLTI